MKVDGSVINIDLGGLRRSIEAREKLKERALENAASQAPLKEVDVSRLINTSSEKGRVLHVIA